MKTTRIVAVPALAAASLLALTGCFQLPPVGGTQTTEEPGGGTTQEPGGGTASDDLAGTSWSGELGPGFATMDFTLNADGTVDISDWNDGDGGPFDEDADVWSGDPSNLTVTITQLTDQNQDSESFDVTFTGTAEGGQMDLSGEAPDGTWTLTATQG
jgi:hypothetical protein